MGASMLLPGARLSKGVPFGCLAESGVGLCCPKAVDTDAECFGTAQHPICLSAVTDCPCPCQEMPKKLTESNRWQSDLSVLTVKLELLSGL